MYLYIPSIYTSEVYLYLKRWVVILCVTGAIRSRILAAILVRAFASMLTFRTILRHWCDSVTTSNAVSCAGTFTRYCGVAVGSVVFLQMSCTTNAVPGLLVLCPGSCSNTSGMTSMEGDRLKSATAHRLAPVIGSGESCPAHVSSVDPLATSMQNSPPTVTPPTLSSSMMSVAVERMVLPPAVVSSAASRTKVSRPLPSQRECGTGPSCFLKQH